VRGGIIQKGDDVALIFAQERLFIRSESALWRRVRWQPRSAGRC
jgi:hypothetical protein